MFCFLGLVKCITLHCHIVNKKGGLFCPILRQLGLLIQENLMFYCLSAVGHLMSLIFNLTDGCSTNISRSPTNTYYSDTGALGLRRTPGVQMVELSSPLVVG